MEKIKEGYIKDIISGKMIKSTPEEVDAVQVFAKQLIEDYKYPKAVIQTRPQYRVKVRPSDVKKEYPVDIAIFSTKSKKEEDCYIIVECKKKNRKDGRTQLEDYLRFSRAALGVWFNGEERLFIRKIEKSGRVEFKDIPNIPNYGQRLEDIGIFKRGDLKTPHNLKTIFEAIRNYLAGNFAGATRDEELAKELINLIFCKIFDEKYTKPDDMIEFRVGLDEEREIVKKRILSIFEKVKKKYSAVIDFSDEIKLDKNAICYVVGELQNYCLIDSERDVIADAFETFIGGALKGSQGQFFTPRNVVKLMVEIVKPQPEDIIIDPACGSGGFLIESLRYVWNELEDNAREYNWDSPTLGAEKMDVAINHIHGIEKDNFLSKVAKAYMAIIGVEKGGIFCDDGLEEPFNWNSKTQQNIELSKYDILLTNPPFGKDIKVSGESKLSQYNLGYKWKKDEGSFQKTDQLKEEEAPQIIFIDRALQLLKDGGKLGIILPETFFHAPMSRYVLDYMLKNNNVTWVVDLPHNTFRPHNNAKCIFIVLEKNVKQGEYINMAVAEEIGHNHQGKEKYRWNYETMKVDKEDLWDDIPLIIDEINNGFSKYCFKIRFSDVLKQKVLVPRYYWENKVIVLEHIAKNQNCTLISISDLVEQGVVKCFDGHGSPEAENKGMGDIPYIRVKDIVNWEIYKDPTAKIPLEVYKAKKGRGKDLKKEDIVYVRRGSYRIGSVAMVSELDKEVLLTREILVIRLNKRNKYNLTPYYLLYLLSHYLVQEQTKNKVLIETTLPNIADRWKELRLPISNSIDEIADISDKVKKVMHHKWRASKEIKKIRESLGDFTT